MSEVSRRTFVKGVATGAGVLAIGFDPVQRSWTTKASAHSGIHVPNLDGALFTDLETRLEYATDFGNLVHRTPMAVLQPGSVNDVVKMVSFCKRNCIKVAARGQGHSTAGQSQVEGGVVIDMSTLSDIESIGPSHVKVQGGLRWRDLLEEVVPDGLTPPVLTGYVGLSIGGTLSMGGIGAASFRHGAQVNNVLELQVVTGTGKLVTCSPTKNSTLFNAVLGGVGQYGIIVRATLPLLPVAPMARNYIIAYTDSASYFTDMNKLTSAGQVDGVYGQINTDGQGGWVYLIIAVKFFHPGSAPVDTQILSGLNFPAPALQVMDMDTLSFDTFVDTQLEFLDSIGLHQIPHVWGDYFVPASKMKSFVDSELARLTPADLGPSGFILVFPIKNRRQDLAFRLPNESNGFLFDILCSALPADAASFKATQIPKARAVFERARAIGSTIYPIGSTPMNKLDWAFQYGPMALRLALAKLLHDPLKIMTPGANIY